MAKRATPATIKLPDVLMQRLGMIAAASETPTGIAALVVRVLTNYADNVPHFQREGYVDRLPPTPKLDDVLDPTTGRCVEAMRDVIAQLVNGDGKVGLTDFVDSASAPAAGSHATRELQVTIVSVVKS